MRVNPQTVVRFCFAPLAIGVILAAVASAVTITVYDGVGAGDLRADWEAAVGSFTEEDFNDNVANDFAFVTLGPGHTHSSQGINGGALHDRLVPGNATQFNFSTPLSAFGASWDLSAGGTGLGIRINAGGTIVPVEVPNSHTGHFFGFTSDMPFTSVILTIGTQVGVAETYDLDNAVYVFIPEPASTCLAVLGLAAPALLRIRKRR